ncbi:MAG: hypothetical protein IJK09_03995 [Prevotella sp.]|nr:hypothetical protein [Prevotella sp.]
MSKKNPAKLEVKPVAWAGEIVTKYQGFITVTRPDGKEKVMTGEPHAVRGCCQTESEERDYAAS